MRLLILQYALLYAKAFSVAKPALNREYIDEYRFTVFIDLQIVTLSYISA